MSNPWYLGAQDDSIEYIFKLCLEKKNDRKVAELLLHYTRRIKDNLHKTLFEVIMRGLTMSIEEPTHKTSDFLCEICAAYEFQFKNKNAGKLKTTLECINKNPYLAHHLVRMCNEIQDMCPGNGLQWFRARSCIMDICTASKMLESSTRINIFYGGEYHAKSIGEILNIEGMCNEENDADDLYALSEHIDSYNTIENLHKTKKYILLGEYHSKTKIYFAEKLLEFCNKKCNGNEKISIFIEKHPSNGIDFVQQDLTCNLQNDISIQRFRCNYKKCDNVNFYDVDFRHVELGFLRYDFLCLDYDKQFQSLSREFQEECITHLKIIGTICM